MTTADALVSPVQSLQLASRIFHIPELLHLIFSFLDKESNVSNACVCKFWSDIALDTVWKEVDDLIHLFSILQPVSMDMHGTYQFEDIPGVSDWARFQKYARRVRCVRFNSDSREGAAEAVLDEVARTRTSFEILPNLRELVWTCHDLCDLQRCLLFLHGQLKHLTVPMWSELGKPSPLLADICARAPNLHTLRLHINESDTQLLDQIQVVARNLHHLRKIVLPEFHFTSEVIQELSRMPNLGVIEFQHDLAMGPGNPKNVEQFAPVLADGAFPALYDLNLTARIDDLERFFHNPFAPVNITTLYVNSYARHSAAEVHSFLSTLSQECKRLSRLHVILLNKDINQTACTEDEQLSFCTLQPLFSISDLTWFEIMHKYPLRITQDEVEELAMRLPSLEALELNPEPLFTRNPTLDLEALLPFANHCPKLRYLGLFMHATSFEAPSARASFKRLHALQIMNVGTSTVQSPKAVAAFLSLLLPPWCRLQFGITWTGRGTLEHRSLDLNTLVELSEGVDPWEEISTLLPALIQVRREEWERTRALTKEVEDLRIRTRLVRDFAERPPRDSCIIC
ncbi:hypothetical protein PISMIDRAFT_682506 [Pisolithus microcarpus 441]|uniref:F-box domain-containing protein n=1 Tax=Pisolithus microcarpus 441 TaxID=765257 RepID=A0A0C9Y681_9AGAM|nr:hypothetical protein PISMIDRAFT_682506 [Pisolithus microcarpus 441]